MRTTSGNRFSQLTTKLGSIYQNFGILPLVFLLAVGMTACDPEDDQVVLPENQAPVIQRILPSINNQLLARNESIQLSFRIADQEKLAKFTLSLQVVNPQNTVLSDSVVLQEGTSGTIQTVNYSSSLSAYPEFSHLIYTATVTDSENLTASTTYELDILSDSREEPLYKIFDIGIKNLYQENQDSSFIMNLTTQRVWNDYDGNLLDMDIAVVNGGGESYTPQLISPAADESGERRVFIKATSDTLNYENVTHEVLFRAFSAYSGQELTKVPVEKDVLILVRLTRAPAPQFAILKIEDVLDETGTSNDRMVFSYKVTSP
ncbi:MAG: hypothetical protein AAGC85_18275 [Bacteroidota bacterium]